MINLPPNKDSIQSRLNRIKQSNQNKQNFQTPPPNSQLLQNFSSTLPPLTKNNTIISSLSSSINSDNIKTEVGSSLSSGNISKDKFSYFVQQANEMFQSYELQLMQLKKRTTFFDYNNLTISNLPNFTLSPKKRDKVMHEIRKLTKEEFHTLEEIKTGFTEKICDLLVENENLSNTLNKISLEVVNKLQEKIFQLNEINKKETQAKNALEIQLSSLDSVFKQNEEMKNEIKEDKINIEKLEKLKKEHETSIMELSLQMVALKNEIKIRRETIENKSKEINDLNIKIKELNKEINIRDETITQRNGKIKEKESEIELLCSSNIEWEEKFNLKCKEIENFKKWSLWDQDLIESFKKIEALSEENKKNTEIITNLTQESNNLKVNNSELSTELRELKEQLNNLKNENTSLTIVKFEYEKQKIKYEELVQMEKEYINYKKEQRELLDKLQSEIKMKDVNYEIQIEDVRNDYDNKISTIKRDYESQIKKANDDIEASLKEKNNIILELQNNMKIAAQFTEEAKITLEKKNQAVQNISEAYDILKKKFSEKEDYIKKLEEGGTNRSGSTSHHNFLSIDNKQNEQPTKLYSSFDKYTFTKSIMIDYLYCLYLLENTITIQSVTSHIFANLNLYLSTIFSNNHNHSLNSVYTEFLEDLFYFSYDFLIQKRFEKYPEDKTNPDMYLANFEDFDRETLEQICKELLKKNFITSLKPTQSFDHIKKLFIQKYTKLFDFDSDLGEFIEKEIIPTITVRLERYSKGLMDNTLMLVEMALNNLKSGKIILDNKEIYSFQKYFTQYQNQRISPIGISKVKFELFKRIDINEELDNSIHSIKAYRPHEVILNKCFDDNIKMDGLKRILTGIILYNQKINSLSLNQLLLTGESFMEFIVSVLGILKELHTVDLSENLINEADIKSLSSFLKTSKNIKVLRLNNNNISSAGGYYIADALTKNKVLEQLHLDNNKLNEGGLSSIFNVLANNNTTLKVLSIADNELNNEDFTALAEYLGSSPVLESLDLSGNKILPLSANIVGVSVKKARNLKAIKMNRTDLNEESASHFLSMLNETNVQDLEMDGNSFGEMGPVVVINKIKMSNKVRRISFKNCDIPSLFLELLSKALPSLNNLESINLEQNNFDDGSFKKFCSSMEFGSKIIVKFSRLLLPKGADEIACEKPNIILL